jgi:hypothetical protein
MDVEEVLLQSARLMEMSRGLIDETCICISQTRRAISSSRARLKPPVDPDPYSLILDGYPLDSLGGNEQVADGRGLPSHRQPIAEE